MKFPIDAPKSKVLKALEKMGFRIERERSHIVLFNDETKTSLTIPNHPYLKASTMQTTLRDCGVDKPTFLRFYYKL